MTQHAEKFNHAGLLEKAKEGLLAIQHSMPRAELHDWRMNSDTAVEHTTLSQLRSSGNGGFLAKGEFLFFPETGRAVLPPADSQNWASANAEWQAADGLIYTATPTDCEGMTTIKVITPDVLNTAA